MQVSGQSVAFSVTVNRNDRASLVQIAATYPPGDRIHHQIGFKRGYMQIRADVADQMEIAKRQDKALQRHACRLENFQYQRYFQNLITLLIRIDSQTVFVFSLCELFEIRFHNNLNHPAWLNGFKRCRKQ